MQIPSSAIKKLKTKNRDNTQTAIIVLIKYGIFKSKDVDDAIAAVNSKDTWVLPSLLPDYDDSIENDIIVGRETEKIIKIRNIIASHYGINLSNNQSTLTQGTIEEQNEIPEQVISEESNIEKISQRVSEKKEDEVGTEDSKKNTTSTDTIDTPSIKSSVDEDDLVEEEIDERILRLLNLEDVFDIDYGTYLTLIKEKLISSRMVDSKLSTEEDDLLKEEFKRIRGKVGRFKPKPKLKIDNITGISLVKSPKSEIQLTPSQDKPKRSSIFYGIISILKDINKLVDNVYGAILTSNSLLASQLELDRRETENLRRREEEDRLEKKENPIIEKAKKIFAPIESIFDRILRFLVFTILGRAFKLFMDWASNPENRKKLETIGRFLKDWWPALLGAWFFFANPLGRFIRTIIGTVAKLTFKLAKFAIPKLLKFVAKNPKAVAAAGLFTAGLTVPSLFPSTVNEQERKTESAPGTDEDKLQSLKTQRQNLNFFDRLQGKGSEIDEQIHFLETGETKKYGFNSGGIIEPLIEGVSKGGTIPSFYSGIVDKDTGETVSGAGPDTQFLPIEDGGGAVLQRGEIVMNKATVDAVGPEYLLGLNRKYGGPNANKPRKLNSNVLANSGGLIGLNNGGQVGINDPNFWITAAISGKEAGHIPQGQADVAQSIYNRSRVGIYPGGKDIRKIIVAPGQYQPTFGNAGSWNSIRDRKSAVNVIKDEKLVDMSATSLLNPTLRINAANFVGSRTDFMGESQKKHMKPSKGDITRGERHNFFGWFTENGLANKLPSPAPVPFAPSNKVGPRIVGSGIPGVPPVLYNIQNKIRNIRDIIQNRRDGGIINENTNYNNFAIPKESIEKTLYNIRNLRANSLERQGRTQESTLLKIFNTFNKTKNIISENTGVKNPYSSSDRRILPIFDNNFGGFAALQPGEVVITKEAVDKLGGPDKVNELNYFDRSSNIFKKGNIPSIMYKNTIKPPDIKPPTSSSSGKVIPISLPPINGNTRSLSQPIKNSSGTTVPPFAVISPVGMNVRINNADIYGIVG